MNFSRIFTSYMTMVKRNTEKCFIERSAIMYDVYSVY